MKKILWIIVLGLLWCNVGFAEIKEIESKKITSHKDKVITTVCVDGYKFVIVENQNGISITQAFFYKPGKPFNAKDFPSKAAPEECDME
tara:strand:- start:50 stop:316 length:267 start_codon:yes stop_codon:yes gene_type:complete